MLLSADGSKAVEMTLIRIWIPDEQKWQRHLNVSMHSDEWLLRVLRFTLGKR